MTRTPLVALRSAAALHWRDLCRYLGAARAAAVYYLAGLYHRMAYQHLFLFSGGLAFSAIVCVVPLVFVVFFVLGAVLDPSSLDLPLSFLAGVISPDPRYASFIEEMILGRVREVIADRKIYGFFGIGGLLFAASGLFSTMRTILTTIYQIPPHKRGPRGIVRDFGMVLLVLAAFLVVVACSPVLEVLQDARFAALLGNFSAWGWARDYLYSVFSFAFIAAVFFALYTLVPRQPLDRKARALSALWVAVLWEVIKQAFGYYLTHFASMQKIYGAYALIIGMILWVYCASIVFVLGAEIGQLYREKTAAPPPAEEPSC